MDCLSGIFVKLVKILSVVNSLHFLLLSQSSSTSQSPGFKYILNISVEVSHRYTMKKGFKKHLIFWSTGYKKNRELKFPPFMNILFLFVWLLWNTIQNSVFLWSEEKNLENEHGGHEFENIALAQKGALLTVCEEWIHFLFLTVCLFVQRMRICFICINT